MELPEIVSPRGFMPDPDRNVSPMIIVAGHLIVDPDTRQEAIEDRLEVMIAARAAAGCLDFSIAADPIEPDRINIYERWESADAVESFRGDGPGDEQQAAIRSADVAQYEIADMTSLT